MFKDYKSNASVSIIISTVLFVLYVVFIAFPFLATNQPPNESTSKWAYDYAPVHYAMIYFPAFALYVYSILKNILNVKHIRWLIYPVVFVMLFVAIHMVFFVYSMAILWFGLVTIPLGFIGLIAIEILAIILDIKEHKKGSESGVNSNESVQKTLHIIGALVIPVSLVCFILLLHFMITVFDPNMELQADKQNLLQCERNKQVIQTAMNNVNVDLNNASYEDISDKFKKEFLRKDIYEPLLGNRYDSVQVRTGGYYSEFEFSSRFLDGSLIRALYTFKRDDKCRKNSENCFWQTGGSCKIFIDENGKIIN